jgi:class 3 adenylate cyclase
MPRESGSAVTHPAEKISSREEILDRVLKKAAFRGERLVATLRLILSSLMLARYVVMVAVGNLAPPPTKMVLIIGAMVLSLLFSALTLELYRRGSLTMRFLVLSPLVDACFIFGALSASVIWPSDHYMGHLRTMETAIYMMAVVATGMRLSRAAIAGGAMANVGAGTFLIIYEQHANADIVRSNNFDVVLYYLLMFFAAVMAWFYAERTKRILVEGVSKTEKAERARQRLGVYVSEEIANRALEEDAPQLGGENLKVAVLFSDLRGFTRYAAGLSPDSLVKELNAYLDAMVGAIKKNGGVIDKFIGDAIMVVFGLPRPDGEEAARAIAAAWAMTRALEDHNKDRLEKGLPPLEQGIGVHYGSVVAGNIGTKDRMQFTVVGDAVNLASRLESATKEEGVPILMSKDIIDALPEISLSKLPPIRPMGKVRVKGREKPMATFVFDQEDRV